MIPEADAAAIVAADIAADASAKAAPQRSKNRTVVEFLTVVFVLFVPFPTIVEGGVGGAEGNNPTRAKSCSPEADDAAVAAENFGGGGPKTMTDVASATGREK